jgi:translation initiation factor 1 (eIF-1/SUI1)
VSRRKERVDAATTPGFGGSFGDLLRAAAPALAAQAAAASPVAPAPAASPPASAAAALGPLRLRVDRKGRGGRAVVRVEGLLGGQAGLDAEQVQALLRGLRAGLGLGASVEAQDVLVQGEDIARVTAWLRAAGYRVA